ncbi:hypothetical protein DY000_02031626 [Brassica cretica]|uniref:Uncharacterized protein n=1 Tax=Brassica cretica TaxID=69181 RepID=A0ABQ7DH93_BRACR|nr:hypothetical protein DY000_02031626 [Brassica cretica]
MRPDMSLCSEWRSDRSLLSEWKQAKKSPTCFCRKISTETPIETKRKALTMRIQKRKKRRTLFRPGRSLRSEWGVGLSSVATNRAVCLLGRYVATELCNRSVALPFSAINLGVFCGFWENKFYPSEMFSENKFEKSRARFIVLPMAKSRSKVFDFLKNCGVCIGVGHRRSVAGVFLPALV